MPRKPRVEFAGAVYHVMSRGNHQQKVFRTDEDCEIFLTTLGEVCGRTGWKVHAYILMGNHYHLLLETTEANLVVGMQWLQSTYTKRFNASHREWGHLFQGRYKAIPVEPAGHYFLTVATYIHLNPVRMKGYDFKSKKLQEYSWSSYPAYTGKVSRPEWLSIRRVLDNLGLADTQAGRRKYGEYMGGRVEEVRHSDQPWLADENWRNIRRGWFLGGDRFRQEILDRLDGALKKGKRDSYNGEEVLNHDESRAEALIVAGLAKLGLKESDLAAMIKNCPEKYALAWLVRRNTFVSNGWIKEHLHMGKATNFAELLKKLAAAKHGGWGYDSFAKVKNIKS
ncbi:MAG: transposase [Kiritimatiellae bacterium]|nr:transposase [Kiritimatiellia bacterium]MDY0148827.1 transposase [Kiritimatiellia bacterium]